jgi:hypothetical protein
MRSYDINGDNFTNVYNWLVNDKPIMLVNMPFDINLSDSTSGALKDYSGNGNNGTLNTSGGYPPGAVNIIEKFPFAITVTASDVGDLTIVKRFIREGVDSQSHGYIYGGFDPANVPVGVGRVDKFSFATDGNAVVAATHPSDAGRYGASASQD